MPDFLGQSYSPATQQADLQQRRRRLPVQQALQTLSLQMPTYGGGGPGSAINRNLLAGGQAGVGVGPGAQANYGNAITQALMGGGGGFGGGGFGGGGPVASAGGGAKAPTGGGATGATGAPLGAPTTTAAAPGGGGRYSGLQTFGKNVAQQMSGLAKPSAKMGLPAIPAGAQQALQSASSWGKALAAPKKKLASIKRPFEAPEPGSPGYINPNVPGGGLLDRLVSPPITQPKPVVLPPTAPPVSFGRPSAPTFAGPTGGYYRPGGMYNQNYQYQIPGYSPY